MTKLFPKPYSLNPNSGFTLVEALASLLIFTVLIVAVSSLFIQIINLQRRALNMQRVDENASFILETMAKEIRVSEVTSANSNCPSLPDYSLVIDHPVNGLITYDYDQSGKNLLRITSTNGSGDVINSALVSVISANFCVSGRGSGLQPRVTLWFTLQSGAGNNQITRTIQTTVSQRIIKE